jgi:hypothetical protein
LESRHLIEERRIHTVNVDDLECLKEFEDRFESHLRPR